MSINKIKVLLLSIIYAIMSPGMAYAVSYVFTNPIKADSFDKVVLGFAKLLAQVGLPIAAIFIVWSGFLFVTARSQKHLLLDNFGYRRDSGSLRHRHGSCELRQTIIK